MKENILVISLFSNPYEQSSSRIYKVQKILQEYNYDHTLVTTNFDHLKKEKFVFLSSKQIVHLQVPTYKKNITLKRFWSHTVFALKLLLYLLKKGKIFSSIYVTSPTSLSALVTILYGKLNNKKVIVDVIDLWPESFVVLFPKIKYLLFPWYLTSFAVYKYADKLFAESKRYADYIQRWNKNKVDYINLGMDFNTIEYSMQNGRAAFAKKKDICYICYGGNLGNSYDFEVIIEALQILKSKNYTNFHFVFIGNGDKKEYLQKQILEYNLPASITGKLSYIDFLKTLSQCDIGINTFLKDSEVVYSYKFNDYVSAGLAVVNNLQGETYEIVQKYNIGLNFDYETNLLSERLEYLLMNQKQLNKMKIDALKYAKEFLDYRSDYKKLIDYLEIQKS